MSTEVITKERPILFSGPMVRAILDGRKAVTRRIIKPQPPGECEILPCHFSESGWSLSNVKGGCDCKAVPCPYGVPYDRLWVRESHAIPSYGDMKILGSLAQYQSVLYRADVGNQVMELGGNWTLHDSDCKWRPSIHMPRWACRIVLEINSVRAERLHEITDEDAIQEGMHEFKLTTGSVFGFDPRGTPGPDLCDTAVGAFEALWKKINGAASWNGNPWVWRVEFKRVQQ